MTYEQVREQVRNHLGARRETDLEEAVNCEVDEQRRQLSLRHTRSMTVDKLRKAAEERIAVWFTSELDEPKMLTPETVLDRRWPVLAAYALAHLLRKHMPAVEVTPDTPNTVAEKAKRARAIAESARRILGGGGT